MACDDSVSSPHVRRIRVLEAELRATLTRETMAWNELETLRGSVSSEPWTSIDEAWFEWAKARLKSDASWKARAEKTEARVAELEAEHEHRHYGCTWRLPFEAREKEGDRNAKG